MVVVAEFSAGEAAGVRLLFGPTSLHSDLLAVMARRIYLGCKVVSHHGRRWIPFIVDGMCRGFVTAGVTMG